jgi:hypothetical protein
LNQTGTSFNDTVNTSSDNSFSWQTATGISQIDPNEAIAPQFVGPETRAPKRVANFDQSYADSTQHTWLDAGNAGTFLSREHVVCHGTYALMSGSNINNNARKVNSYNTCSSGESAANISHVTDHVSCTFVGDVNGVTGYAVSAPFLTLRMYIPSSDGAFDIDQINQTGSSLTPGAASVQCAVTRP